MNKVFAERIITVIILLTSINNYCFSQDVSGFDERIEQAVAAEDLGKAASYANKAAFELWNRMQFEEAIRYFEKALDFSQQMNNLKGIMVIEYNIGMIYSDLEQYDKALPHLVNGLNISRSFNQKASIASGLSNVALALQGMGRHEEAIQKLEEAISIAKEINDIKLLRRSYGLMYENYEELGQSEKAFEYFDLYSSFDREIKKVEMDQVKVEAESKVNQAVAEKKQTEEVLNQTSAILKETADSLVKAEKLTREQKLEIELRDALLREEEAQRKFMIQFVTVAGILILIIFIILYLAYQLKRRSNKLLSKQNKEIEQYSNQLEIQNKNITSSINYAQNIQAAILPGQEIDNKLFDSFILFWPKDIVSGDFYWHSHFAPNGNNEHHIFSVIDCTGHGVPGAFMSMIGNQLLNEIINERKIFKPSQILEVLDKEVRAALKQDITDNNDGMDMVLCNIEIRGDEKILTFSGAKRPLYIINKDTIKIKRLKGDRRSIGGLLTKKVKADFTDQTIILKSGDTLYLSTDGVIDQNGPDRKRFGSKRFEEALLSISQFPMQDQKQELSKTIKEYIKNEEQRDDITIMGCRIK